MNTRYKVIFNFIAFQLGWFSCVLMAARQMPEVGVLVALSLVAIHVLIQSQRMYEIFLLLTVALIGSIWDSFLTAYGVLVFKSGMINEYLAPSWIMAMWLMFATTLTVSFRWLYGRYWLAMVMGAVFGPLAYQGGAALGAVEMPNFVTAMFVLAIGWGVLMPVLIRLAEWFQQHTTARDFAS